VVEDDRLPGGPEVVVRRTGSPQPARPRFSPKVKNGDVRVEEGAGAREPVVQLDLQLHRVGLQVDQPAGGECSAAARCRRAG
jgi:hypothetical protein